MGAAAAPGKAAGPSPACRQSCPASRDFNALGAKNGPNFRRRRVSEGGRLRARRRCAERIVVYYKPLISLSNMPSDGEPAARRDNRLDVKDASRASRPSQAIARARSPIARSGCCVQQRLRPITRPLTLPLPAAARGEGRAAPPFLPLSLFTPDKRFAFAAERQGEGRLLLSAPRTAVRGS